MDEQEILEAINTQVNTSLTEFTGTMEAKLSEIPDAIKKAFEPDEVKSAAEVKAEDAKKEDAELEKGPLAGVIDMEVWDIPIGKALVGGFTAVLASELIDGFLASQGNMVLGLVKLIGAGAAFKWGQGLLGKGGAGALALLLAYDGIRHILPIDQWASRLATGVSGIATTRGLGGNKDTVIPPGGNGHKEGYYDRLKGGVS